MSSGVRSPRPTRPGTCACSSVSTSISTPIVASFSRAISLSISAGTGYTFRSSSPACCDGVLEAERLVRERHVHHERRMALGGREVDEPAVGDQVDAAAVGERELLDELARHARLARERTQRRDLDLDVEVARVREDRAVLHQLDSARAVMTFLSPVAVQKMSPISAAFSIVMHLEAVHRRLERPHRIDLGDDHVRAEAAGARRDAAPDPAVAGDDELLAGEQHVRRADDPVDRRLARAVAVVEHVLRQRLVDGDDREAELALRLERLQPDDAGRRLLGAGDDVAELLAPGRVQHADHVGAVVHREVRLVVDRSLDVRVVRVVVLALDREDRDVVLLDERRGDVVLRRERVRRAEHDVGAAGLQRAHEVRRLRRHVQARRDAVAARAAAPRSKRSRIAASTGICRSAHSIRRLPSPARARSFTS